MLDLREFIAEITPIINKKTKEMPELTEEDWCKYVELLSILKLTYDATIKMQAEQIAPSDFFAIWFELKLKLSKHKNIPFAKRILDGMLNRENEKNILNAAPILASVFLDSRYRVLLTSEQKQQACEHLDRLWTRLKQLQSQAAAPINNIENVINDEEFDSLAQLLEARSKHSTNLNFCAV